MKKKYTCIDLFCGCGGLSKGFELAGFDVIGGIDFNDAPRGFYKISKDQFEAILKETASEGRFIVD